MREKTFVLIVLSSYLAASTITRSELTDLSIDLQQRWLALGLRAGFRLADWWDTQAAVTFPRVCSTSQVPDIWAA